METKRLLYSTVYNSLVMSGVKPDISNMNVKYLKLLYETVDYVYFNGGLQKYINNNPKLSVKFEINNKLTKIAGSCGRHGCVYYIRMGDRIFMNPFKKFPKQSVNGIFCYNPLMCYINVFLHEMIHFIIFMFCPEREKTEGDYGKSFKDIVYNFFGQTSVNHLLGREVLDVEVTADLLSINQKVWWINDKDGKIMSGFISRKNPKTVSISNWIIPYYMIRINKPEGEDVHELTNTNETFNKSSVGKNIWWISSKDGTIHCDTITKKNPKNVITSTGWKIPYFMVLLKKPIKSVVRTINKSNPKPIIIKVGRIIKITDEYMKYNIGKISKIDGNEISVILMNEDGKYIGYSNAVNRADIIGNPTKQEISIHKKDIRKLIKSFKV